MRHVLDNSVKGERQLCGFPVPKTAANNARNFINHAQPHNEGNVGVGVSVSVCCCNRIQVLKCCLCEHLNCSCDCRQGVDNRFEGEVSELTPCKLYDLWHCCCKSDQIYILLRQTERRQFDKYSNQFINGRMPSTCWSLLLFFFLFFFSICTCLTTAGR